MAFLYVAATLSSVILPYLMSTIVDEGIAREDMQVILVTGAWMLLFAALSLGCSLLTARLNAKLASGIACDLQKGLFQKVSTLTFEQHASVGTASLLTRSTHDVMTVRDAASMLLNVLVTVPILFFGGCLFAFLSDWVLALIFLAAAPLVLVLVRLISRTLGSRWEKADAYIDAQNRIMRERLLGIRVIRAFDTESHEHARIAEATERMADNIIRANVRANALTPVCMLLLNLATIVMLWAGSVRLQDAELLARGLTAGDIIATVQYVALILNGLLMLSWTFVFLPHVKVSIRRIAEVLSMETVQELPGKGILKQADVRMEGVSFRYPNSEVDAIVDLDLVVKQGETVAVIGGTGSGKSTLVKLLMAFYPIKTGRFTVGGIDAAELGTATIRENFSVALQKAMLFEGTIESNILVGKPEAASEEVEEVVRIAMLEDFVASQEEGIKHPISQAGTNVSGGQKQRINIARTILRPANLYLFDDSFSALDYLTESKLRRGLNRYLAGKSQLIITQRAATAMRCDRIYVMEQGRVVGEGTHDSLMDTCTVYREIVRSQLGGDHEE